MELQAIHLFTLICQSILGFRSHHVQPYYVDSTLCKSQIETCFFSRFSRQKRPWWFLGNTFVEAVSNLFIHGPKKIAQNCCTNQKLLRSQPILQLYQCHIRGFRMTFGPRLISYSEKIWTKMRPNIKGHQKNGSVPKWIEFDTNRSNTMNILKLELKPLPSGFQNPGGRRILSVVP